MEKCNNNVPAEEEKWWGDKTLHQINGFWFMPFIVPRIHRVLAEFNPRPNDVILVSFPKTGTTWLKSLVYSIINSSSLDSLVNNHPHDLVPYLEVQVFGDIQESSSSSSESTYVSENTYPHHCETNLDLTGLTQNSNLNSVDETNSDLTVRVKKSLIQNSNPDSVDETNSNLTARVEKSMTQNSNLDSAEVGPEFDSEKSDTTRIFNTHIPYQLLGKALESSGCRVVYVARNPKDTLNSLWHFVNKWKMAEEAPWELEEAVEKFLLGVVPAGPYYEHVLGYKMASLKNPSKIFFITYEELKDDTKTHVKRLAEFLGCPFGKDDDNEVEEIVKCCSIEVLKNHEVNKSENCPDWFPTPYNSFFRQGKVGDHKKYFSDEAIERIDALTKEKFHKSDFIYGI